MIKVRARNACSLSFPGIRYNLIRSFRDPETEKTFRQQFSKRFQGIEKTAIRRLFQLHQAVTLQDLAAIPGNRLEKLTADRKGQYSLRINDQFRICFTWEDGEASNVEIVDYH